MWSRPAHLMISERRKRARETGRRTEDGYGEDQEQINEEELRDHELQSAPMDEMTTCLEVAQVGG